MLRFKLCRMAGLPTRHPQARRLLLLSSRSRAKSSSRSGTKSWAGRTHLQRRIQPARGPWALTRTCVCTSHGHRCPLRLLSACPLPLGRSKRRWLRFPSTRPRPIHRGPTARPSPSSTAHRSRRGVVGVAGFAEMRGEAPVTGEGPAISARVQDMSPVQDRLVVTRRALLGEHKSLGPGSHNYTNSSSECS